MHTRCGPCRAWLKRAPDVITQADYRVLRASKPRNVNQDRSQCFVSALEVHHAGSDAVDFKEGGYITVQFTKGRYTWDFHTKEQFQGLTECWTGGVYLDNSGHAVVVLSDAANRPFGPPHVNDQTQVPLSGTNHMMEEDDAQQVVQEAGLPEGLTRVPIRVFLNKMQLCNAHVDLNVGPGGSVEVVYGDVEAMITGLNLPVYDCGYYWDAAGKTLVKLINHVTAPPYPRKMDLRLVKEADIIHALQEKQDGTFTAAADSTAPPTVKVLAHDGDTTEEMMDQDDGGSISAHMHTKEAGQEATKEKQAQLDIMANHPANTIAYTNGNGCSVSNGTPKYDPGTRSLRVYAMNPEGTHRVNALWVDALTYGRLSPSSPRFLICDEVYEPLQGCERVTAGRLLELVGCKRGAQELQCVCLTEEFVRMGLLYETGTPIPKLLKQRSFSRNSSQIIMQDDTEETETEDELHELTRPLGPAQPAYSMEMAMANALGNLQEDLKKLGLSYVKGDWDIKTNLRKDMRWEYKYTYKKMGFKSRKQALMYLCDKHNIIPRKFAVTRSRIKQSRVRSMPEPSKVSNLSTSSSSLSHDISMQDDTEETETEDELHELTRPSSPAQPAYSMGIAAAKALVDLQTDLTQLGLPYVKEDWDIKTYLRKDARWQHMYSYKGIHFPSRLKALLYLCDKHNIDASNIKVSRTHMTQAHKRSMPDTSQEPPVASKAKRCKQSHPKSSMGINDLVEAALAAPRVSKRPARWAAVAGVAAATAAVQMSGAPEEAPEEQAMWGSDYPDHVRKQPMTAGASATQPMQDENPYGNQAMYQDQPAGEDEEDDYQYGNEYDDILPPATHDWRHAAIASGSVAQAYTLTLQRHVAAQGSKPTARALPLPHSQPAYRPADQAYGLAKAAAPSCPPPHPCPTPTQPVPAACPHTSPSLPLASPASLAPITTPTPAPTAVPAPAHTAAPATAATLIDEPVSLQALQKMLPKIEGVQQTPEGNVVLTHDIRQTAFVAVCCVLRSLDKAEAAEALFLKWRRHYSASPAGSKEFLDAYVMLQGAAQFSEAAMLGVLREDFKLPL